jgi:hypothetical protein
MYLRHPPLEHSRSAFDSARRFDRTVFRESCTTLHPSLRFGGLLQMQMLQLRSYFELFSKRQPKADSFCVKSSQSMPPLSQKKEKNRRSELLLKSENKEATVRQQNN